MNNLKLAALLKKLEKCDAELEECDKLIERTEQQIDAILERRESLLFLFKRAST